MNKLMTINFFKLFHVLSDDYHLIQHDNSIICLENKELKFKDEFSYICLEDENIKELSKDYYISKSYKYKYVVSMKVIN